MTYIRRKDDVIFSTNAKIEDIDTSIYKKVADTIEELCDEFVVDYGIDKIVYKQLNWAIDKATRGTYPYTIYAAIWTDKGLIYVAKLNDKGELELI